MNRIWHSAFVFLTAKYLLNEKNLFNDIRICFVFEVLVFLFPFEKQGYGFLKDFVFTFISGWIPKNHLVFSVDYGGYFIYNISVTILPSLGSLLDLIINISTS